MTKERNTPVMSFPELEGLVRLRGAKIQRELPNPACPDGAWFIAGTNRVVGAHLIKKALTDGLLVGANDGLFGDSQTLILKP